MKDKSPSLLDVLAKASASDLAAIDEQIAKKQGELDALSKKLVDDLAALQQLRKVVNVKVNGKPPRKKPERKAKKGGGAATSTAATPPTESGSLVAKIAAVLKANGACLTTTIAKKLGDVNQEHSVRMCLGANKDKFTRNDDGTWETFV